MTEKIIHIKVKALPHLQLISCSLLLTSFIALPIRADLPSAINAFNQANFEQAKPLLEAAVSQARNENNKPVENQALYFLGRACYELGDLETAKDRLNEAVEIEPNTSEEYYWLGRVYGDLALHSGILKQVSYANSTHKYFQLAVDANPKNAMAQRALFSFQIMAPSIMGGSIEKAEKTLLTLRALSPVDADIKEVDLLRKKEQRDLLLTKARYLTTTYPTNAEALVVAASTILDQKKLENPDLEKQRLMEVTTVFETAANLPVTQQNRIFVETAIYQFAEICLSTNVYTDTAIKMLETLITSPSHSKRLNINWPTWTLAKLYRNKGDEQKFVSLKQQLDPAYIEQDKRLRDDIELHGTKAIGK